MESTEKRIPGTAPRTWTKEEREQAALYLSKKYSVKVIQRRIGMIRYQRKVATEQNNESAIFNLDVMETVELKAIEYILENEI